MLITKLGGFLNLTWISCYIIFLLIFHVIVILTEIFYYNNQLYSIRVNNTLNFFFFFTYFFILIKVKYYIYIFFLSWTLLFFLIFSFVLLLFFLKKIKSFKIGVMLHKHWAFCTKKLRFIETFLFDDDNFDQTIIAYNFYPNLLIRLLHLTLSLYIVTIGLSASLNFFFFYFCFNPKSIKNIKVSKQFFISLLVIIITGVPLFLLTKLKEITLQPSFYDIFNEILVQLTSYFLMLEIFIYSQAINTTSSGINFVCKKL